LLASREKMGYIDKFINFLYILAEKVEERIWMGSVVKKRKKKMSKHKHRKLMKKTRHQRKKRGK
jgi:Mitochondrial mRNA-processing protein COX24, C-terminal